MARNKDNVAEFSLTLKEDNYKGETYHRLVGSFKNGGKNILVSIACDDSGQPKIYESEKGKRFCYARAVKFNKTQSSTRRNEMK